MKDLSASIVVYKNSVEILEKTIQSFLRNTQDSNLYIIDNSPTDRLKALVNDTRIIYRFNNRNVGFGAAHNTVLREILNESKYHIIMNPDVYFEEGTIQKLYTLMNFQLSKRTMQILSQNSWIHLGFEPNWSSLQVRCIANSASDPIGGK